MKADDEGGILFQILVPRTEKARFPNWVRVLTTTAALVVKEKSWQRPQLAQSRTAVAIIDQRTLLWAS